MVRKTYLLPPNLTTHPGGTFSIGTIITDPFNPLKPLSTSKDALNTVTHTELESELRHGSDKGFSSSVWANFLQIANAKVSGGVSTNFLSTYRFTSLETITLRDYPSEEYAATRANEPKVKAAMNAGLLGRAPVYMISGLKIAKGFHSTQEQGRRVHGGVGGTVPITEQVSAGAEVSGEKGTLYSYSSRTEDDIVFAYQLHVIADKGWRARRTTIDEFVPKGGLLRKNNEGQEADVIDATEATEEDLVQIDEEDEVKAKEAREGDETCVCLYLEA